MMDPHLNIRKLLPDYSQENVYGNKYYDDNIFDIIESSELENPKGIDFESRFRDIVSDPNNLFITRVDGSGLINDGIITLHNGLKIYSNSYYGNFSKIFTINKGVHEPCEERSFQKVLDVLGENSVMIELGSYWAFYSIWFMKNCKGGKSYCIESEYEYLQKGLKNFELNGVEGEFHQGFIGKDGVNLLEFVKEKNIEQIDILHSDIQGNEFEMLSQIDELLFNKRITYLFISTHSNEIHFDCINKLAQCGYRIITSCDFDNETYQFDGFILSCPNNLFEIPNFKIGNRSKSKVIQKLLSSI